MSLRCCWFQWCNKGVLVNLVGVIGLCFSVFAFKSYSFWTDYHTDQNKYQGNIYWLFFLQKCMTEEIHDDDGVEPTGAGPGGASAAASPLSHVHGSFGAVAMSGVLTA